MKVHGKDENNAIYQFMQTKNISVGPEQVCVVISASTPLTWLLQST